jgi:hypothetical protein
MLDYHLQAGADLAMLLNRSIGQKFAQIARQSLKISNEESDQIVGTLQNLETLLSQPTLAQKMRVIAHPQGSLARQLLPSLAAIGFDADSVRTIATELDSLAINDCSPTPFITPGRQFKQVLDAVYDAQLEARVTTAETAMQLAKSLMAAR